MSWRSGSLTGQIRPSCTASDESADPVGSAIKIFPHPAFLIISFSCNKNSNPAQPPSSPCIVTQTFPAWTLPSPREPAGLLLGIQRVACLPQESSRECDVDSLVTLSGPSLSSSSLNLPLIHCSHTGYLLAAFPAHCETGLLGPGPSCCPNDLPDLSHHLLRCSLFRALPSQFFTALTGVCVCVHVCVFSPLD